MTERSLANKDEIHDKLEFVKGALNLLKETNLFGPLFDEVVEDIEEIKTALADGLSK